MIAMMVLSDIYAVSLQKINEWAQTANFSVLSRLRQELCAENPQNMENKGNYNVNYSTFWISTNYPG